MAILLLTRSLRSRLRPSVSSVAAVAFSSGPAASAVTVEVERATRDGPRNDWSWPEIQTIYDSPLLNLLFHGMSNTKGALLPFFQGAANRRPSPDPRNPSMHCVGSASNTAGSGRPRKEKRFTYVLNDVNNKKHCAGINCLAYLNASAIGTSDYLFTGSRDGTLKRWELKNGDASFSMPVNDAIIVGQPLVSCSSHTTLKVWNCLSDGACTRTLRQHSDYVICLAAVDKNSNIVASGGLGGEVFIWDLDVALAPVAKSVDGKEDEIHNGNNGPSSNIVSTNGKSHGHSPIAAQGHKDSVYTLAMNDTGTLLVSGGTEKLVRVWDARTGSKNMKLRGHTDNIRALLLDSTGRLWDLGQQRCVHSYAVHTDSVWALASTPSFAHVYSGGRDQSVYLTDLSTRESVLLCTSSLDEEFLILRL